MFDSGKRTLLVLMLCIGVFQMVAYYLAGSLSSGDGAFAIAQPDTLLYCQAARRIIEGYPFSFSAGTAVSTGTTSHLHPFCLAVLYWLGAKGDALLRAGFFLNAFFYLVFLWGWGLVVCTLIRVPIVRWVAGILIACFGQTAYSAFAQSDIGLWMAVSALLVAGLVRQKIWLFGILLMLGPWVRPEGMICVFAFGVCLLARWLLDQVSVVRSLPPVRRADLMWFVLGIGSVVGVFTLNYALMGECQFSSVAHKGHFYFSNSLGGGIMRSGTDFVEIVKSLFFGLSKGAPRDFYFVPVLGAILFWLGVCTFDWKKFCDWRLAVWPLAILGGVLSVATSGWQDTNNNRYFAWLMPTILVFTASGVEWLRENCYTRTVSTIMAFILVCFTAGMAVVQLGSFTSASHDADGLRAFAKVCEDKMEDGASVGSFGECGIAYEFSSRRVANLSGIYSPEFFQGEWPVGKFEILKNDPSLRFDYWFMNPAEMDVTLGFKTFGVLGKQVLVGPKGYELQKADWLRFDAAARLPVPPKGNLSLTSRVDVAYAADERNAGYEILPSYAYVRFYPMLTHAKLGTADLIEGGRLVVGQDEMTVPTIPGKELFVVMRTIDRCTATQNGEFTPVERVYAFSNPLKLNLQVDGVLAGLGEVKLATNAFSDVTFTIPGKFITKERSRIAFCGDHVAYAYWFYQ